MTSEWFRGLRIIFMCRLKTGNITCRPSATEIVVHIPIGAFWSRGKCCIYAIALDTIRKFGAQVRPEAIGWVAVWSRDFSLQVLVEENKEVYSLVAWIWWPCIASWQQPAPVNHNRQLPRILMHRDRRAWWLYFSMMFRRGTRLIEHYSCRHNITWSIRIWCLMHAQSLFTLTSFLSALSKWTAKGVCLFALFEFVVTRGRGSSVIQLLVDARRIAWRMSLFWSWKNTCRSPFDSMHEAIEVSLSRLDEITGAWGRLNDTAVSK